MLPERGGGAGGGGGGSLERDSAESHAERFRQQQAEGITRITTAQTDKVALKVVLNLGEMSCVAFCVNCVQCESHQTQLFSFFLFLFFLNYKGAPEM